MRPLRQAPPPPGDPHPERRATRTSPDERARRALARRALASLLVATLAACSDDGNDNDDAKDGVATTETTQPTTTTIPVEQEVEEAYLAYWEMLERLAANPDPEDAEIHRRASGEALDELVDGLRTMHVAGWRSEFGDQHLHNVLSVIVEGGDAEVQHCAVDDSRVIDTATGEVVREGIATIFYEGALKETNAGWQVYNISETDSAPSAHGCL